MVLSQKKLFLYAGIGLAVSGVATIFLIYQGLELTDASDEQQNDAFDQDDNQFQMEEVHANPNLVTHIHAVLELYDENGQKLGVPAEIGIAPELWHDHSLDQFGPSRGLLAPLHTHDTTGTIHIESVVHRNYTLGEFLSIWGIDQSSTIVEVRTDEGTAIKEYQNHILGRNEKLIVEVRTL